MMDKQELKHQKHNELTSSVRLKEIVAVLTKRDIIHGVTPEKLRLILEDLGPTYVKIGQIMSLRSDVLPQRYCQELIKLRAEVKPIPFSDVVQLIEQEYGKPVKDVFTSIEEKPLGSASIAQVHAVVLLDGRRAVVKVQRPGIYEIMAQDIALMRKAAKLIQKIEISSDAIDFNHVIKELWAVAQEEMDFILEARNCQEISRLNKDIMYVTFPKIEEQLSTARVLVMEYIDGVQIDDTSRLEQLGYDMEEIGEKLAANYIKQVLDDGFFHADPHPGNIWIREGKIVWLDLGMVGRLSDHDKKLFKKAVQAIVDKDVFELKDVVLSLGKVKGSVNHSRLYNDIEMMLNKYGDLDLNEMNLGEMVQEMLDLCNVNGISTPSRVTMLARGILTIEGVLAYCCPKTNFMGIAASHLSQKAFSDFDFSKEMRLNSKSLFSFGKKAIEVPGHLADLLQLLVKGHAKVNLDVTGAEQPIKQIDHMVDKLIICIISAALLIGSSLISTTQMKPQVLDIPLFGILGFLTSFFLSGWLLYGIIKRWRRK